MTAAFDAAINLSVDELRSYHLAAGTAIATCMKLQGFEYEVADTIGSGATIVKQDQKTTEQLEATGFMPIPISIGISPHDREIRDAIERRKDSDPAFRQALLGSDDGTVEGCEAIGYRRAQGDSEFIDLQATAQNMRAELRSQVMASPAYSAALDRWIACMEPLGYDFADPSALAASNWPEPRPSTPEVSAARADRSCKQSGGLLAVGLDVEEQLTSQLLEQNPTLVSDLTEAKDELVKSSSSILSDG